MERRTFGIFAFCACLLVLALCSCQSGPDVIQDNTGDIIDTQSDLAAGAAIVAAGAGAIETGAADIYATLGAMAKEDPSLAPVAGKAADHAEAARLHAIEARELQASVEKARLEVVTVTKRAALAEGLYHQSEAGRLKAEGQRNAAWIILGALAMLAAVAIYLKMRGFP